MALYVVTKSEKSNQANIPLPGFFVKAVNTLAKLDEIELVQADGDELNYIKARFTNLPASHAICVWRGEMARFIAENLS